MRLALVVSLLPVLLCLGTTQVQAGIILDDFNRADTTDMGPNWNETFGDFQIVGGRARGDGLGTMIFVGATADAITADVYKLGTSSAYIALILGYADTHNCIYVKVQSQDGTADFESLGFYFGRNGNNNGSWSQSFFDSTTLTPFASGSLTLSLIGDVVTLEIDADFDGAADQTISRGSVPLGLLGTGIGLGAWIASGSEVDNFGLAVIPEPSSILLLGAAGLLLAGLSRRRKR